MEKGVTMNTLPAFGKAAPEFALPGADGKDVALWEYRGRPIVLLFYCFDWGTI
jgi:peroxiredoxin